MIILVLIIALALLPVAIEVAYTVFLALLVPPLVLLGMMKRPIKKQVASPSGYACAKCKLPSQKWQHDNCNVQPVKRQAPQFACAKCKLPSLNWQHAVC